MIKISLFPWKNRWEALLNCTTIEELKDTLRSNLEKLSEGLEQQTHTRTARLIQQIYDYIDQNYQCYDLSVNSISAAFQMSPASISKLFKRETNTGFWIILIMSVYSMQKNYCCLRPTPFLRLRNWWAIPMYPLLFVFTRNMKGYLPEW